MPLTSYPQVVLWQVGMIYGTFLTHYFALLTSFPSVVLPDLATHLR